MISEITNLRILRHQNILKLFEIYESSELIHLIFEYVQGETLSEVIKTKRHFDLEKEAAEIMESLLKSLAFCHASGIIHRDIKPANIMVRYYL